jgi:NADPH:quinone reductase-like Zn-dependent oxidoreductase
MARFGKMVRRTLLALLAVGTLALTALALVLSHDSPCVDAAGAAPGADSMKGIVYHCYGTPQVLRLEDIARPAPTGNQVLVKVQAAAVNPLDWHYMKGTPYLMRMQTGIGAPKSSRLGVDFAGTVEAVGPEVKHYKPGDDVFGGRTGAFAEYVTVPEDRALALKPANVSFAQAAALTIAAITALQALRDKGRVEAGQKVLINGASGGVGTFAVQLAKNFGAEVTGVCSTRNVELVRSLGADHVIDYTREDFTRGEQHYDLIVDLVGSHSVLAYRHVLADHGSLVIVGGPDGKWLGPFANPLAALLVRPFVSQRMGMMLGDLNAADLALLADLMRAGKLKAVIDRSYPLNQTAAALAYLLEGHARGKVVIDVGGTGQP